MKRRTLCMYILSLAIALNGCALSGTPSNPPSSSEESTVEPSGSDPADLSSESSSSQASSETSDTPKTIIIDGYTVRYPDNLFYHWLDRDYSHICVEDSEGNDITNIAIDLWYCANSIYNVDSTEMSGIGEFASLQEYAIPQCSEFLNYSDVVTNIFTEHGIAQLEQTSFVSEGNYLIRKIGEKVYRMDSYKSGFNIADTLVDMQVAERSDDRIALSVEYLVKGFVDDPNEPGFYEPIPYTVNFVIAKMGDQWLVDDYIYPEAVTK